MKSYDVTVCDNCGFGFADRLPPPEIFNRYYADMSKYEYLEAEGKASTYDMLRFSVVADLIEQVLPNRQAAVLDVGCATAGLLAELKSRGYKNLLGLDPSLACAKFAMQNYGIEVITQNLAAINPLTRHFKLVMFCGVLEHLCLPKEMLTKIHTCLDNSGLLLLSVPNVTGFASCLDAPFQQFSIEHVAFFSPISLANIAAICGFSLTRMECIQFSQSATSRMPCIEAVFRKSPKAGSWQFDNQTEPALQSYIKDSREMDAQILQVIDGLANEQLPVVVWGVGTHTQRLWETTRLSKANIRAFIDSNAHYQGKKLQGIPILAPQHLLDHRESILVSSCVRQKDIVEQVKSMGLPNKVICLYNSSQTATLAKKRTLGMGTNDTSSMIGVKH